MHYRSRWSPTRRLLCTQLTYSATSLAAMVTPTTNFSSRASLISVGHLLSSRSHIVDVAQPCPLLDVIPPIRSLILDHMDDCTAIRYLSTCSTLHAGYHEYGVKQAMSVASFMEVTELESFFHRVIRAVWFVTVQSCLLVPCYASLLWHPPFLIFLGVFLAFLLATTAYLGWLWLTWRRDCCTRGKPGMWRRRYIIPRVQRLSEKLSDLRLLPYLQHLTELTTAHHKRWSLGTGNPLPRSLRTLRLLNSPDLLLEPDTLPPHLTSLSLSAIKHTQLPVGVLPQSLTSLHFTYGFDTRCGIGANVLPSGLLKLKLYEWTLPLSHIALPASLTDLDIRSLSDHPLSALPPQLQVLAVGGAFSQPLTGVLPPTLRVLRLTGAFDQPLSADTFTCTPQLEELWLSDRSPARELAAAMLPRTLLVLRLGKLCLLTMTDASNMPPQLRRLMVPAGWAAERVRRFKQLGCNYGFTVEREAA